MSDTLERIEKHGNASIDYINLLDILAQGIEDEVLRVAIEDSIRNLRTELAAFAAGIFDHLAEESNA